MDILVIIVWNTYLIIASIVMGLGLGTMIATTIDTVFAKRDRT